MLFFLGDGWYCRVVFGRSGVVGLGDLVVVLFGGNL